MDEIQKILIKQGRKDLAQKYYEKITSKNFSRSTTKDRHIVASLNLGHVSYEIWKKKDGEFDVVKSSYPKEHSDFKKVMSKKDISEHFLIDIINNTIKAFVTDKDERKKIVEKLGKE